MPNSWRPTLMELLPRLTQTLLLPLPSTTLPRVSPPGPHWREQPMFILPLSPLWSMGVRRGLLMPRLFLGILMDTLPTLMLWLHLPLLLPIQMELLSLQSPRMLLMLELNIWQLLLRLAVRRDQLMPRL